MPGHFGSLKSREKPYNTSKTELLKDQKLRVLWKDDDSLAPPRAAPAMMMLKSTIEAALAMLKAITDRLQGSGCGKNAERA